MRISRATAAERLSADRLERLGDSSAVYGCPACATGTSISFSTFDHLLQAALQAALPGVRTDDAAAQAFDQTHPLDSGQRGLDAACEGCGARFRIVGEGGEQSREGALDYRLVGVVEQAPETARDRGTVIVLVITAAVALALLVGGAFTIQAALDEERERAVLVERGVRADATITGESLRNRAPATLHIQFAVADSGFQDAILTVPILSGWHAGDSHLQVVYDPQHTSTVRTASAVQRRPWGYVLAALALIVAGSWLLWLVVRRMLVLIRS